MLGHPPLHQQMFRWDIKKKFFTETGAKHLNRVPGQWCLEVFKKW